MRVTSALGSHCPVGPNEPLQLGAEVRAHSVQLVGRRVGIEEEPSKVRLVQLALVLLREKGVNQPLVSGTTASTTARHLGLRGCDKATFLY